MKFDSPHLIRQTLLVASLLVCATHPAQAEEKPDPRPTTVRILCLAEDKIPRYKTLPNGFSVAIPFAYDECPPLSVSLKTGDDYKTVPYVRGGLGEKIVLPEKPTPTDAGFYFQALAEIRPDEKPVVSAPHAKQKKGAKPERTAEPWHPLAPCPKPDGKDHLLCLFNPDTQGKWYPCKTLDVDISENALPSGKCLVLNLSTKTIHIQIGERTKPVSLAPGGTFAVIGTPAAEEIRIKAAAVAPKTKPVVVYNRRQPFPSDKRTIVAFFEAAPSLNLAAEVRTLTLPSASEIIATP